MATSASASHACASRSASSPSVVEVRVRAVTRTSTAGIAVRKRCSLGTSQQVANDGATLTVSVDRLRVSRMAADAS